MCSYFFSSKNASCTTYRLDFSLLIHTELIIILTKMIMTGAMSVVVPGSPIQLVLASLVMMTFTLTSLKFAPYRKRVDDWMSFMVSLVSSGNTLAGCLLIMDKMIVDSGGKPNFNPEVMEALLLTVNIGLLAIQLIVMVLIKYGCWRKLMKTACAEKLLCGCTEDSSNFDARQDVGAAGGRRISPRKVVPENSSAGGAADGISGRVGDEEDENAEALRAWGSAGGHAL